MPFPLPPSTSFFYEVVLPGALGCTLAYLLLPGWAKVESAVGLAVFAALSVVAGTMPRLLSTHIWRFWWGIYWIPFVRSYAIRGLQRQATLAASKPKDLWDSMKRTVGLGDVFLDVQGGGKTAILPTVLGNGILKFALHLYGHFYAQEVPKGQPSPEAVMGIIIRAWFDLRRDVRLEISDGLAIGAGLINLSVIAFGVGVMYVLRIAFGHAAQPYLLMAVLCFLVSRVSYVLGTTQWLSGLDVVRVLILSKTQSQTEMRKSAGGS